MPRIPCLIPFSDFSAHLSSVPFSIFVLSSTSCVVSDVMPSELSSSLQVFSLLSPAFVVSVNSAFNLN